MSSLKRWARVPLTGKMDKRSFSWRGGRDVSYRDVSKISLLEGWARVLVKEMAGGYVVRVKVQKSLCCKEDKGPIY